MIQNLNPITFRDFGVVLPERKTVRTGSESGNTLQLRMQDEEAVVYRAAAQTHLCLGSGMSVLSVSVDGAGKSIVIDAISAILGQRAYRDMIRTGAAEGAGLGHDFLRHIDRCRLLVHVVDVSGSEGRDPVADFDAICAELKNYSVDLSNRPMIVAANKTDLLPPDSDNLERLRVHVEAAGCELYEISAGTTQGTRNLMRVVAEKLRTLPPVTIYEPEYVEPVIAAGDPSELEIEHLGSTWVVTGTWLERLVMNINFDDYESRNYFDQQLRKCGLFARLEEMGIQDGDTVDIYDFEFEYQR